MDLTKSRTYQQWKREGYIAGCNGNRDLSPTIAEIWGPKSAEAYSEGFEEGDDVYLRDKSTHAFR